MENETVEPTIEMTISGALEAVAAALVATTREQTAQRGMLEKLLRERKELTELVAGLNIKVATLTALADSDHAVLTRLARLPGRPKGDRSAN